MVTGFMLLEVLVSVLLFSVGVLAVVGLQASMSRAQAASKDRADAAALATEVVGVMWTDMSHIASYATASCSGYGQCADWQTKVAATLPNGSSTITVSTTATNTYDVTIVITWSLPDGGQHTYSTVTTIAAAS
jgi:type IV pilus assembly protein PilV